MAKISKGKMREIRKLWKRRGVDASEREIKRILFGLEEGEHMGPQREMTHAGLEL